MQCYSLDGGYTKFTDLLQLVEFYQVNPGGLPTRLKHYVSRLMWWLLSSHNFMYINEWHIWTFYRWSFWKSLIYWNLFFIGCFCLVTKRERERGWLEPAIQAVKSSDSQLRWSHLMQITRIQGPACFLIIVSVCTMFIARIKNTGMW